MEEKNFSGSFDYLKDINNVYNYFLSQTKSLGTYIKHMIYREIELSEQRQ